MQAPTITTKARNDTLASHTVFIDGVESTKVIITKFCGRGNRHGYAAYSITTGNPIGHPDTIGGVRRQLARIIYRQRQARAAS